jgi:hypothetical protein
MIYQENSCLTDGFPLFFNKPFPLTLLQLSTGLGHNPTKLPTSLAFLETALNFTKISKNAKNK